MSNSVIAYIIKHFIEEVYLIDNQKVKKNGKYGEISFTIKFTSF